MPPSARGELLVPPVNITDYRGQPLPPNDALLQNCASGLIRRLRREAKLPPLIIDPLAPLPLADAVAGGPAVHIIYFIMASRHYAHETINRNVRALQRPGAISVAPGSNQSNLFLVHMDAKMSGSDAQQLRTQVASRPDVYFIRRPRPVMWAGISMMYALLDALASVVERSLGFEYVINLSDADLTLRVDGEIRDFFAHYPGRSIMSIVPQKRDPRRYKLHEGFRKHCWVRAVLSLL